MLDQELLARLTPYAVPEMSDALEATLARVASVPGAVWRPEWIDLLFRNLPAELKAEMLAAVKAAPAPAIAHGPGRLALLRETFDALAIDAFVAPQRNRHGLRDMPADERRLEWLTGFTGSAGDAVIARDQAWLFVDGRYELQAEQELADAGGEVTPRHHLKPPIWTFLAETLRPGARIGYDPRLHVVAELKTAAETLAKNDIVLAPVERNPIDQIWPADQRAPRPFAAVVPHPLERTGRDSVEKRTMIAAEMKKAGVEALVLSELEAMAWALNIRGGDAETTPITQSYAILHGDGQADLFIERAKLTPSAVDHLGNSVAVAEYEAFEAALRDLGRSGATIGFDRRRTTAHIAEILAAAGAKTEAMQDPTIKMRERKTEAELAGFREALARDGAAAVKYLRWIAELDLAAPPDEHEVAERITAFRAEDPTFRGISFAPIVGSGPNGAIIHYGPPETGSRRLREGEPLLIDSGGQYLAGTSDITRTVAIGAPSARARSVSTAVLKAHIALASTQFPAGATGAQLDGIARAPLWAMGLEFDHGTGHGIGSYLAVHEGAVRIARAGGEPVAAGNVLSNEPGAYIKGAFGVRHENTVIVRELESEATKTPFLRLETITAAPFDRAMIDRAMLTDAERAWLNQYHAFARETVEPYLDGADMDWLRAATAPI